MKPRSALFYNTDLLEEDSIRRMFRKQAEKLFARIEMGVAAIATVAGAYIGGTTFVSTSTTVSCNRDKRTLLPEGICINKAHCNTTIFKMNYTHCG